MITPYIPTNRASFQLRRRRLARFSRNISSTVKAGTAIGNIHVNRRTIPLPNTRTGTLRNTYFGATSTVLTCARIVAAIRARCRVTRHATIRSRISTPVRPRCAPASVPRSSRQTPHRGELSIARLSAHQQARGGSRSQTRQALTQSVSCDSDIREEADRQTERLQEQYPQESCAHCRSSGGARGSAMVHR